MKPEQKKQPQEEDGNKAKVGRRRKSWKKDKVKEEKRAVSPYFLPGSDVVLSP